MSVLSDGTITALAESGVLGIDPFDPELVQPSSIDVRSSNKFRVFHNGRYPYIDVRKDLKDLTEEVEIEGDRPFILHPGEFILGSTVESFKIPDNIVARLEGKSSLGRLGLLVHSTAGYIDPGFDGTITLELSNIATLPITIYAGMKIGQVSFAIMDAPALKPYGSPGLGSKYQGQDKPTASKFHENFDPDPGNY